MAKKEEGISEKAVHTKGPWKIQEAFNRIETDRETIATVDGWELGNGKANARLIAAAPDLLAKCEKIVAWLDRLAANSEFSAEHNNFQSLAEAQRADAKNYRKTADDIRISIRKARGEQL